MEGGDQTPANGRGTAGHAFGWPVVKHVKSNAIVYAASDRTLGMGAGQMSRVDASKIAVWKARESGLLAARQRGVQRCLFPFADGLVGRGRSRRNRGHPTGRLSARCRSDCGGRRTQHGHGFHGRPAFSPLINDSASRSPPPGQDTSAPRPIQVSHSRQRRAGLLHGAEAEPQGHAAQGNHVAIAQEGRGIGTPLTLASAPGSTSRTKPSFANGFCSDTAKPPVPPRTHPTAPNARL